MTSGPTMQASVPMPLQVVIDDVGWWSGKDGHEIGEPYRTGIDRNHTLADYEALIRLGRRLVIRPQLALILCEWDRENILRDYPTCTWMGADWDNRRWTGPHLDDAAGYLRRNSAYAELTLHGVGHEYWDSGQPSRAEWADKAGNARPADRIGAHLHAFGAIMEQNGLGEFPSSFVPAAFCYPYGEEEGSLASILAEHGIEFISTPFASMTKHQEPQSPWFGVEQGIMIVDRGREPTIPWDEIASTPSTCAGPILGLHWANLLHPDPSDNDEVVDRWVDHLSSQNRRLDLVLAANTADCRDQLAHHALATVEVVGHEIRLDFRELRRFPHIRSLRHAFTLKVRSLKRPRFSSANAKLRFLSHDDETGISAMRVEVSPVQAHARITAQ
jgi:hypothetical protein